MDKKYYSHKLSVMIISLLLIISSGELMYENFYRVTSIVFLFLVIVIVIIENKYNQLPISASLYLLYLFIALIINIIINKEPYMNNYIGVFVKLLTVFLCGIVVGLKEFKEAYTKIMYVLCFVSLVFYIIGIIYPAMVFLLPEIRIVSSTVYYKYAIVHSFRYVHGFVNLNNFSKNSSIFWEPGAYQFFLNIALYFEMNKSKKSVIRVMIYMAGIISTFSTTGILTLFIILASKVKLRRYINIKTLFGSVVIIVVIIICTYKNIDIYFNKFQQGSNSYISYESRMTNTSQDFNIILNNPFGVGYTNYFIYHEGGSENSVTSMWCMYGLLYVIPIYCSILLLAFIVDSSLSRFIVFPLIIFISCVSEKFFFTPILMYLSVLSIFEINNINFTRRDYEKNCDCNQYQSTL